jgi:hypothetical protein
MATFAGVFWLSAGAMAEEPASRADRRVADARAPASSRKAESPEEERLSDEAELARVVSLVEAAKYEECAARLSRLLDPTGPHPLKQPEIIETARLYHATCLIGLGKAEAADVPLREAVRQNPQMRAPDSLIFPARVVDRFIRVREQLYDELRKVEHDTIERARREAAAKQKLENERWSRMLALERMAKQEVVVVQNSRWIAAVPFGAGQFQNGNKPLGWIFLASELALGATAITSTAVYTHIQAEADRYVNEGRPPGDEINKRLHDWRTALMIGAYGFLSVAAVGVLEAQLSFVPEVRHVRERKLPFALQVSGVTLTPDVAAGAHDVSLGVRGAF